MRLTIYRHIICLLLFSVVVNTLSAQNFVEDFEKVNNYYKTTSNYNIEVAYKMYRGYTGNVVTESYDGTMYKNDNVVGTTALNAEVITFPDTQITINETNKTLVYLKIDKKNIKKSVIDIVQLSKYYEQTAVNEKENVIIYELSLKKRALNISYNKLIFYVNKIDFSLIKQEFLFAYKLPFTNQKGEREHDLGRMEISYNASTKSRKKNIKLEDYIVIKKNNVIVLTKKYHNFQLINQTSHK